jgi:hypothetical protein
MGPQIKYEKITTQTMLSEGLWFRGGGNSENH